MKKNRVLFLDLDLRRPVQANNLCITVPKQQNLGTLLEQNASPKEIISNAFPLLENNLYALLSAKNYPNAAELIASRALSDLLIHAKKYFDYVILDLPPAGYFSEGEIMLDQADAAVLVARQDVVPAAVINDCIDVLRGGRAEFLGYVLNDVNTLSTARDAYGYNRYGYYNKYYGKQRSGSHGFNWSNQVDRVHSKIGKSNDSK
jgi:Mrp family chromosome partitioning ATPase